MSKILFLDIDGVCNNHRTKQVFEGFLGIDPNLAPIIRGIVLATGCEVVLSSTWRLTPSACDEVRRKVCPFIDVTPDMPDKLRGEEVAAWLAEHPEVERYAIVDDDNDFLLGQPLFQTRWQEGITPEIADLIIKYLT